MKQKRYVGEDGYTHYRNADTDEKCLCGYPSVKRVSPLTTRTYPSCPACLRVIKNTEDKNV